MSENSMQAKSEIASLEQVEVWTLSFFQISRKFKKSYKFIGNKIYQAYNLALMDSLLD